MRKRIVKNIGIGKKIPFTFHPVFTEGARDVIESNFINLNDDFKNGVAFALASEFNSQIIPLMTKLDDQGKIEILDQDLFLPLIDSDYLSLSDILYYNNEYFPGMDDAVTVLNNIDAPVSELNVLAKGDDSDSKRRIRVGDCQINELID